MTTQQKRTLVVVCLCSMLVMLDNSIVNVALPAMSRSLSAAPSQLQWIVDAYSLVFASLLLPAGYLADRYGQRRLLVWGIVGFLGTSVAAAVVTTAPMLIAARAAQGIFAAMILPATLAIVSHTFSAGRQRALAMSAWAAAAGVAVAIGPLAGGALLSRFGWSSVFWINVPAAAGLVVLVIVIVPKVQSEVVGRFDYFGAIGAMTTSFFLVWSIIEGPSQGWSDPMIVGGFTVSAVIGGVLLWHQARREHALIDVRLFTDTRFTGSVSTISLAFFSMFGFTFLATQYFQIVRGWTALDTGVRFLPFAGAVVVGAPLAIVLARRISAAVSITTGVVLLASGFWLATTFEPDTSYLSVIVPTIALMGAGVSCVQSAATTTIMNTLPVAKAGAGSAINDTTRQVGGTLGVAVLGSIFTQTFTTDTADERRLMERFLPRSEHLDSLSEVLANRALRTGSPGIQQSIDDSFVHGMNNATTAAAIALTIGAPVAFLLTRNSSGATPGDAGVPSKARTTTTGQRTRADTRAT